MRNSDCALTPAAIKWGVQLQRRAQPWMFISLAWVGPAVLAAINPLVQSRIFDDRARGRLVPHRSVHAGCLRHCASLADHSRRRRASRCPPSLAFDRVLRGVGLGGHSAKGVDSVHDAEPWRGEILSELVRWNTAVRVRHLPGDGRRRARHSLFRGSARGRTQARPVVTTIDRRPPRCAAGPAESTLSFQ